MKPTSRDRTRFPTGHPAAADRHGPRRSRAATVAVLVALTFANEAAAQEAIWVEGEDCGISEFNQHGWYSSVQTDLLSPGTPGDLANPGSWAAHYANDSVPVQIACDFDVAEGGEYTLWARVGVYRVSTWAAFDGGESVDLDLDNRAREIVNVVAPTLDIRFLGWVDTGPIELDPGHHTVSFGLEPHPSWNGAEI